MRAEYIWRKISLPLWKFWANWYYGRLQSAG